MGSMTPTVRANVKAWECDVMEHMNVQYYLARSAEASGQLQVMLGLSTQPNLALIHRAERVLFMREMHNGDSYTVNSGILSIGENTLSIFSEMHNLDALPNDRESIAARFIIDVQLIDLDTGLPAAFPASAHCAAQAMTIEPPEDLRAKQVLPQPAQRDLTSAEHYGLFDTARGTIEPWECDARGYLHPRFFMSRCSDAVTHLQRHYGLTPRYRQQHGLGSAALEYNIEFHHSFRAGDALITKSGLREMRGKTQHFFHWFFNAATGQTVATVETTGTLFDFEARKSVPMPEELRTLAEPHFIHF
ncbi:MAG: thioesterase family protein [Gammaproteobacteria bacterium]|nr:thioesterase family protein [Gammaproteobacteria bacterium]MBQ0838542.1 thioesterase family protein [Gammaproteobacteria bacterium]